MLDRVVVLVGLDLARFFWSTLIEQPEFKFGPSFHIAACCFCPYLTTVCQGGLALNLPAGAGLSVSGRQLIECFYGNSDALIGQLVTSTLDADGSGVFQLMGTVGRCLDSPEWRLFWLRAVANCGVTGPFVTVGDQIATRIARLTSVWPRERLAPASLTLAKNSL